MDIQSLDEDGAISPNIIQRKLMHYKSYRDLEAVSEAIS